MTKDIFDTPFATLDFVIYSVLLRLGYTPYRLNRYDGDMTPDDIALANATKLLRHFGDRKIQGIKEIREATGLCLMDSKEAYEQIVETYEVRDAAYYLNRARKANLDGESGEVSFYLHKLEEVL
ncbi:MAG: ribosomal protein L7/L12 [Actinobacteria bacterium]|nr:ribosomal protein L7/L12 [Actinomycetota bacterium]